MTTATVKYITNGYIVTGPPLVPVPQTLYALTIAEVVFWLDQIFTGAAVAAEARADVPAPSLIDPSSDPLIGQLAIAQTVDSGGFLVTQLPKLAGSFPPLDVYCVNMDAVSDALTQIFTPPA